MYVKWLLFSTPHSVYLKPPRVDFKCLHHKKQEWHHISIEDSVCVCRVWPFHIDAYFDICCQWNTWDEFCSRSNPCLTEAGKSNITRPIFIMNNPWSWASVVAFNAFLQGSLKFLMLHYCASYHSLHCLLETFTFTNSSSAWGGQLAMLFVWPKTKPQHISFRNLEHKPLCHPI